MTDDITADFKDSAFRDYVLEEFSKEKDGATLYLRQIHQQIGDEARAHRRGVLIFPSLSKHL